MTHLWARYSRLPVSWKRRALALGGRRARDSRGTPRSRSRFLAAQARVHRLVEDLEGPRVRGDEGRRDEVGPARVGEGHERARGGHHAVALVLAVGRVGELLQEGVARVVQGPGEGRVHRELQRLEAVAVDAPGSGPGRGPASSESARRPSAPSTARTASAVVSSRAGHVVDEQRRARVRAGRRGRRPRRRRRPSARGKRASTIASAGSGPSPTRSKNAGSSARTVVHHGPDDGPRLPRQRRRSASSGTAGGARSPTGCGPWR